jgi:hypothetical protein
MTHDVLTILNKLPEICASVNAVDGSPIFIRRGVMGYWKAPLAIDVDAFNAERGITPEQREAMEVGSMFGWEVPGADPDRAAGIHRRSHAA